MQDHRRYEGSKGKFSGDTEQNNVESRISFANRRAIDSENMPRDKKDVFAIIDNRIIQAELESKRVYLYNMELIPRWFMKNQKMVSKNGKDATIIHPKYVVVFQTLEDAEHYLSLTRSKMDILGESTSYFKDGQTYFGFDENKEVIDELSARDGQLFYKDGSPVKFIDAVFRFRSDAEAYRDAPCDYRI